MNEKEAIERLQAFIDRRINEGASKEELDKIYDDLMDLKQNYYVGELFSD